MSAAREDAIAVIGLAGRFPGAPSVAALWDLLRRGERGVTTFTDSELLAAGVSAARLADPRYVKARGALVGTELFDAEHFGFLPREAALLDPQHRLLLECAWEALESAGHASAEARRDGRVGVFASASRSAYETHLRARLDLDPASSDPFALDGALVDFLASRLSHRLDLRGPSVVVQTACSSSLVAVHLACQSLLTGESDLALAGAASIAVPSIAGGFAVEGGMTSPDGWCRAFDARAAGTVGGDAVAAIVLKRLPEAIRDRDFIHAVILGSAINNDGGARVGFTAPSAEGQAAVIRDALSAAGIAPREIGYLEAHGTGTPLGDPIEVAGLARAFAADTRRSACPIGSIKATIGHTDVVAGLAGLIKTILCLRARTLVPTAGFERPSPRIPFAETPFFVQSALAPWPSVAPRRAGVSSFGMGGTNAHVVLEEAPEPAAKIEGLPWKVLVLSARSRSALEAMTSNLADHLAADPGVDLGAVAGSLASGRASFAHRRAALATTTDGAARALADRAPGLVFSGRARPSAPKIAFVHAGLGDHHPGMAAALYRAFPVFRASLDRSAEVLAPLLGLDVRASLVEAPPVDPFRRWIGRAADRGRSPLSSTIEAQPALLALELALQALWASLGVVPAIVLGHSLGELAAAVAAGVFTPDDALALSAARARLIASLPPGAMTVVALSPLEIEAIDAPGVTIAVRSGPRTTVVAGSIDAVAALERRLAEREITCKRLDVEHAVHTAAMRPIAAALTDVVARLPLRAPRLPYLSNVTGARLTADDATRPAYWAEHLCHAVALAPAIDHLVADPDHLIVEIGPGAGLASLARLAAKRLGGPPRTVVTSLPEGRGEDLRHLLGAVAELWIAGATIDWRGLWPEGTPGRVPLPTYPFERSRHWIETEIDDPVAPHDFMSPAPATVPVTPPAEREHALIAAFQASFGFEGIGVHDDFFSLGGHSLLAIQLLHRIRTTLGVDISVRSLIEHRTIAALAEHWDTLAPAAAPAPHDHPGDLIEYAVAQLAEALALPPAQVRDAADLRPLGLESAVADLLRVIKRDFGRPVYPHEILARPSAAALAELLANLQQPPRRSADHSPSPSPSDVGRASAPAAWPSSSEPKNPPIGLILSSARSGSTLLRVMLAGHPDLFCPPELHLLMFRSLRERAAGLPSPHFAQGLQRALMELEGLDAASADARVAALQAADLSVQDTYRLLQDLARPRLVVDKSPSYAERIETLSHALTTFGEARLVVLVRHPYAVIASYVRNRIGTMARAPEAEPEAQAERHWVLCNRNLREFLARTGHAAHRVRFEDLVADPDRSMRGVCAALGVDPRPEVLVPYDGGARMIDGVGDPNLHEHHRIEPELGDAWRRIRLRRPLGAEARALAEELGYELPNEG